MSAFTLIPGAGGAATWYWRLVVPELVARGHRAIAVDLPGPDESAGLPEYAGKVAAVVAQQGDDVVLVAQSMGGFTAPMACARVPVRLLVLLNAMIPVPGETPGAWWDDTGWQQDRLAAARTGGYPEEFDVATYFLHDVPQDVYASGADADHNEAEIAFTQPCAIERWPDVPTRVLAGRDDRFFPAPFQRRVARQRLGLDTDETPGGHLAALSHPAELADRLTRYLD
jgi:pimeloyl-ACP methyl ester carboxylesterase